MLAAMPALGHRLTLVLQILIDVLDSTSNIGRC